jgi:hypothetical protein
MRLNRCLQYYRALDAKGLALAGLAVLEGGSRAVEAIAAFRAAQTITCAPGIIGYVRHLLDALVPADTMGILTEIYEAATTGDGPRG